MTKWTVFADRVNALLEERGLTQREFAEMVGVTEVSMSRYLKPIRIPKVNVIAKCAEVLGVSVDYLCGTDITKDMAPILKPCPFCGAPAKHWEWNGGSRIDCSKWASDGAAVNVHFVGIGAKTFEEAAKLWNERKGEG